MKANFGKMNLHIKLWMTQLTIYGSTLWNVFDMSSPKT